MLLLRGLFELLTSVQLGMRFVPASIALIRPAVDDTWLCSDCPAWLQVFNVCMDSAGLCGMRLAEAGVFFSAGKLLGVTGFLAGKPAPVYKNGYVTLESFVYIFVLRVAEYGGF